MLSRIFPKQLDNTYRGQRVALWLFGLVVTLKLIISTNSILNTRSIAMGADGIPLDSFGPGGAQTVILLFALQALGNMMLALLGVVALIRYRAMIPLLYLLFLIAQIGGRVINALHAAPETAAASNGNIVIYSLIALVVIGLGLSLTGKRYATSAQT